VVSAKRLTLGVPYLELKLKWKTGEEADYFGEAHFSAALKEKSIMLLVKRDESGISKSGLDLVLPFSIACGRDYLRMQWENYTALKEMAQNREDRGAEPAFSKVFGISEGLRLMFGGLVTRPPRVPDFRSRLERELLVDFYEETIFRRGEMPLLVRESRVVVPFAYDPEKGEVRYAGSKKSRFWYAGEVLSSFLKKGLISIEV